MPNSRETVRAEITDGVGRAATQPKATFGWSHVPWRPLRISEKAVESANLRKTNHYRSGLHPARAFSRSSLYIAARPDVISHFGRELQAPCGQLDGCYYTYGRLSNHHCNYLWVI